MAEEVTGVTSSSYSEEDLKRILSPNRKKYDEEIEMLLSSIKDNELKMESIKNITIPQIKDELKALKAEKNATIEKRAQIDADLERLNKDVPEKMRQLNQLESSLIYKNEEKIHSAIQKLEWNLQVQHFKLHEEKKIVSEIDRLKRSKKTLVQYLTLKQEISGIRDRQRRMREERDTYFRAVTNLKKKEEKLKQDFSLDKTSLTELKKDIDQLYEKKRQVVGSFKKQREEFQGIRDRQRRESWRRKEERKKEEAEFDDEYLQLVKELQLCQTLINYLNRYYNSPVQDVSVDSHSPSSSLDEPETIEEPIDSQYVVLKKNGETQGVDYTGGPKRLLKKNRRSRKQSWAKNITHTAQVLEQFMELNLNAPSTISDVPDSLQKLIAKKKYLEKEQQSNEVASEAGFSSTESMSRQASKTESCEGLVETNPGEKVYADLLKEGGGYDNCVTARGTKALQDSSTDKGGPVLDSCIRSVETKLTGFEQHINVISTGDNNNIAKNPISYIEELKPSLLIASKNPNAVFGRGKHQRFSPPKNLDFHQKTMRSAYAKHKWTNTSESASLLVSPSWTLPKTGVSLVSPLDFPSIMEMKSKKPLDRVASSPATVEATNDNKFMQWNLNEKQSPTASLSQSLSSSSKCHKILTARFSSPSTGSTSLWQVQESVAPAILDSEEFPPLSQVKSLPRRSSNLSVKSSNGCIANQDNQVEATQCSDEQLSPCNCDKSNLHVKLDDSKGTIGATTASSPLTVSQIPLADKLSTEKWVETSVAFTKDLCPINCEASSVSIRTESTRL
ncbi:uncharacterized protein LOC131927631 [Physella acuta]|uniref:uncharacterized protein LOC131927631 n=1 Tax=Physella acuta TaxID=109671 RepID=UPI0027DCC1AE|nr:uncharacterized protein LOC131927631 [Physella acuta]